MSIFIETEERRLRFDGQMMFEVGKVIDMYKLLGSKFRCHEREGVIHP
jgi:hypothetical protein